VSVVIPTSGDGEDLRLASFQLPAAVHEHRTGRADLLRPDMATSTADPDDDGATGDGGRIQTA
jgi:hypothetical protein